ncbi:vitamin K epoxide reductase complex subunit 1-like protein 1 isoform X3 [Zophobas morio]|uniref:vitamin K epoxide reductase complex subunit 1-like protein 1 isoform X3 n=1 Tax=Zophobas morio TaxID=2755281 RepID=UPI00308355E9
MKIGILPRSGRIYIPYVKTPFHLCFKTDRRKIIVVRNFRYGKGFGLVSKDSFFYKPNSLLGILFYSLAATLAQSNSPIITRLSYWSTVLANLMSLYFAYVLYFKLYDFCVVCVSIYMVNILCLIFTHLKLRKLIIDARMEASKKAN